MIWAASSAMSRAVTCCRDRSCPRRLAKSRCVMPSSAARLFISAAKCVLRAGDALRERDRRVVAGLNDQAAQQIVDAHLAVDVEKHRRPVRVRAAGAPGVFGDRELVVEMQASFLQLVEHDLRGQQLDGRGRRHRFVGVLLEQHRAALVVDAAARRARWSESLCARAARCGRDEAPATSRTTPERSGEQNKADPRRRGETDRRARPVLASHSKTNQRSRGLGSPRYRSLAATPRLAALRPARSACANGSRRSRRAARRRSARNRAARSPATAACWTRPSRRNGAAPGRPAPITRRDGAQVERRAAAAAALSTIWDCGGAAASAGAGSRSAGAAAARRADEVGQRRRRRGEATIGGAPARRAVDRRRRAVGAQAREQRRIVGAFERRAADIFDFHLRGARALEIEHVGDARGHVHHPPAVIGAAIVDAHDDRIAVGEIGDPGVARQRHRRMRRGERAHVVDFAVGGAPAVERVAVPGGHADGAVGGILARDNRCARRSCRDGRRDIARRRAAPAGRPRRRAGSRGRIWPSRNIRGRVAGVRGEGAARNRPATRRRSASDARSAPGSKPRLDAKHSGGDNHRPKLATATPRKHARRAPERRRWRKQGSADIPSATLSRTSFPKRLMRPPSLREIQPCISPLDIARQRHSQDAQRQCSLSQVTGRTLL